MFVVAALYKFAKIENPKAWEPGLEAYCDSQGVKGILLIANEGINGTIAGTRAGIDAVLSYIKSYTQFADLEHKEAISEEMPFYRMKVRVKKEIVTLGVDSVDPTEKVGTYVEPKDWNKLIEEGVPMIDTRNDYEYKIGTFKGALDPNTETFRQFPDYVKAHLDPKKHKRVAMFCTGGIRCEKASSLMLDMGFEEVYHLKGGILKYLETVPAQESLWEGACFVFDQRVAVEHGLKISDYELCYSCRNPISPEEKLDPKYEEGLTCPGCFHDTSEKKKESLRERMKQIHLAKERGEQHIGRKVRQSNKFI